MRKLSDHKNVKWTLCFGTGALLFSLLVFGVSPRPSTEVQAQVRSSVPRQAFKSGGERSEIVLREISATLKRIDARLERLEKIAASTQFKDAETR